MVGSAGKKIGIIGAMKKEMDDIKAMVSFPESETISGIEFIRGSIHGTPVVVATCGIGKVFAGMCAQTMIMRYDPDMIINVGVAGSLSADLNIGDIAVASGVVQHDMDSSGLGDPPGMISGINIIEIPSDEKTRRSLMACANSLGYKAKEGVIATGDIFIKDKEKKKSLTEDFSAIACEMEGAGIGQVCYVNHKPFCVLRAISDNGDENATGDYDMSVEMAARRATDIIELFLKE